MTDNQGSKSFVGMVVSTRAVGAAPGRVGGAVMAGGSSVVLLGADGKGGSSEFNPTPSDIPTGYVGGFHSGRNMDCRIPEEYWRKFTGR